MRVYCRREIDINWKAAKDVRSSLSPKMRKKWLRSFSEYHWIFHSKKGVISMLHLPSRGSFEPSRWEIYQLEGVKGTEWIEGTESYPTMAQAVKRILGILK